MPTFSELKGAQRLTALLGESVVRYGSPDDDVSVLVARGAIAGCPTVVVCCDGRVRGGTFGLKEADQLSALFAELANQTERPNLVVVFDTGGVRVEEGPAALAAVSAVGVELTEFLHAGGRAVSIVCGPRGCFGAPAVMAALPRRRMVVEPANWGLTGPRLIDSIRALDADTSVSSTLPASRQANGDAQAVVADDVDAILACLNDWLDPNRQVATEPSDLVSAIRASADETAVMAGRLRKSEGYRPVEPRRTRRRGLLESSLRGQWRAEQPTLRVGMVQIGVGTLADRPAVGVIVGPDARPGDGLGIEEAEAITATLARVAEQPGERAMVLSFLFCQGHSVDAAQERFGLHRALAECHRAMVAARLAGHPLVSVLGGGTYGAAYFALAAPSHRILAMQGTTVAPMAPEVLRAFQELRGKTDGPSHDANLAEHIPDVRIVESVIRLPRVLREELTDVIRGIAGRAA